MDIAKPANKVENNVCANCKKFVSWNARESLWYHNDTYSIRCESAPVPEYQEWPEYQPHENRAVISEATGYPGL